VRFLGERLDRPRVAALGLASTGMALVILAPLAGQAGVAIDWFGVCLAFGAAALQTGYAFLMGRGFVVLPPAQSAALLTGTTALFVLALSLLTGMGGVVAAPFSMPDAWPALLAAGSIGAAIPTVAIVSGFRRVGPTRGAILMLFEPVVGVAAAALVLAERPAPIQLVGGVMVLAAAAVLQLGPAQRDLAVEGPPTL
jgi:drug/metabolite transporter (DMT)-like permease